MSITGQRERDFYVPVGPSGIGMARWLGTSKHTNYSVRKSK